MLSLAVIACAQQNPVLQCIANVGATPTVRTEGLTERVGDVVFNCTGGTPLPLGAAVPTTNLTLRFNVPVTNAHTPDGPSDVLLLIDEPGATSSSAPILFQPASISAPPSPIINTGSGTFDGSPGHPNVFQGLVRANQVTFNGVPILAPATNGTRIFRVTNTRVNATSLSDRSPVLATILPANGIAISNPNIDPLATVSQGLSTSISQSFTGSACTPTNFPFTGTPNPTQMANIRFGEGFLNSFKTFSTTQGTGAQRLPPQATQSVPGQNVLGSELGFTLPQINSQVSSGTQFELLFNAPTGVDLYLPVLLGTNSHLVAINQPGGQRQLVVPTAGTFFKVPMTNGRGSAFYEVSDQAANIVESFTVPVVPSFNSGGAAVNSPLPGTVTVNLSFAPLSPILEPHVPNGLTSALIPRFTDRPSFDNGVNKPNSVNDPLALFTFTPCPTNPGLSGILPLGSPTGRISFSASQGEPPPFMQNFIGTSTRDNVTGLNMIPTANNNFVPGTVPEGLDRSATSNWLTVDVTGSATPLTGRVTVNPAGLAPGKYTGNIAFGSAAAGNVNVPVDLTVTGPLPYFTPAAVTSAGSYAGNLVTPGEAIVIFGTRFGPPTLAGLDFSGGQVATMIGETRVLFDGVPAPMIYAVNGQVSAFVPYSVAGNLRTQIQVEYRGVKSNPVIVPVIKAVPALLTSDSSGFGQAAALNQDNSFNLPASPESVGNQVVLFGSGGGQTTPVGRDGKLNGVGGTLPVFNMGPISVTIGGRPAAVAYAGPAPGAVEGVFQVNVTIPQGTPSGPASVVVFFGDYVTQPGVTISVK